MRLTADKDADSVFYLNLFCNLLAMFNADEDELLALNRQHYPTISCNSVLLQGSPVELPRFAGAGVRTSLVRGMQVLKAKSSKEALEDEKWLDVEVFAPENVHYTRVQAVLLHRWGLSLCSRLQGKFMSTTMGVTYTSDWTPCIPQAEWAASSVA
jgi:hypothetical protein